jgi:hypothetical protein
MNTLISGVDDAIVQRYHVRLQWTELRAPSCAAIVAQDREPAKTGFRFEYDVPAPQRGADGSYAGAPVFRLAEIVLQAPSVVAWPNMTETDKERAEAFRRALLHHETGHIQTAEASLRALADEAPITAPDQNTYIAEVQAAGAAGEQRFQRDQAAYESLTNHGLTQERAPGELRGRDTILVCEQR